MPKQLQHGLPTGTNTRLLKKHKSSHSWKGQQPLLLRPGILHTLVPCRGCPAGTGGSPAQACPHCSAWKLKLALHSASLASCDPFQNAPNPVFLSPNKNLRVVSDPETMHKKNGNQLEHGMSRQSPRHSERLQWDVSSELVFRGYRGISSSPLQEGSSSESAQVTGLEDSV